MVKAFRCKKIYTHNGCASGVLTVQDGCFGEILPYDYTDATLDITEADDKLIIPGIIDLHNHGFMGKSVCAETAKPSQQELREYLQALATVGVTGVTPTATVEYFETISQTAAEGYDGARILGIYSEGPFSTRAGENAAVEPPYIPPDVAVVREYLQKSRGLLKIMSLAPEAEGADEVIRYLTSQGVIAAAYHTNATYSEMTHGFQQGISLVTHTGNVMQGIHHRDVGALGAALLDESVDCEIITDFFHLCPEMLTMMFRLKDYSKFLLVSDSMILSGAKPGKYPLFEGFYLQVDEEGFIRDNGGRLCGSSKYVLYGIKNLVQKLDIPMERVMEMASLNPARKLGIADRKGSILCGKDADFVILDSNFDCLETYVEGKRAY